MQTRFRASIALAIGAVAATTAPANALPPFSTANKTGPAIGTASKLVKVTVGHHPAFDRVVFRFTGGRPGWTTHFVAHPVQDGSGAPVTILGSRYLQMSYFPSGAPTFTSLWRVTPRFRTLKQVRSTGDFEAVVSMTAGLRYKAPYRVFGLTSPYRIVVDFKH